MQQSETANDRPAGTPMPRWLKVGYAAFVAVLVPVYWVQYGALNFLWFSNIALLLTLLAVWRGYALVASMMAVAVVLPEIVWNIGYFSRLLFGLDLFGLTGYMFDETIPLYVRALSLYHVVLPLLLLWLLGRWGYDRRALPAQTALGWAVLVTSFVLGDHDENVNWSHATGEYRIMPDLAWLGVLMVALPALVYVPSHLLFRRLFRDCRGG